MSVHLEEIRWLEGRDEGNGTLGNVQGKSFGKTNGEAQSDHSGRGYIGILLDISISIPAPYPLYLLK